MGLLTVRERLPMPAGQTAAGYVAAMTHELEVLGVEGVVAGRGRVDFGAIYLPIATRGRLKIVRGAFVVSGAHVDAEVHLSAWYPVGVLLALAVVIAWYVFGAFHWTVCLAAFALIIVVPQYQVRSLLKRWLEDEHRHGSRMETAGKP
ncbi:hypothetical protein [Usitatibacter palustris]|uniref:Uncharacterized protein n=1 Tax=Usitatibacter palustris TaxID=2732487 RepID=A0A6M4H344_9PROT|nr:hypothetical protein [Usitatibacter palustris]QJR13989.1 hypothetical protein DSM104440_00781 [Usitatibacter palustris]